MKKADLIMDILLIRRENVLLLRSKVVADYEQSCIIKILRMPADIIRVGINRIAIFVYRIHGCSFTKWLIYDIIIT